MSSSSSDGCNADSPCRIQMLLNISEMRKKSAQAVALATTIMDAQSPGLAEGDWYVNHLAPEVTLLNFLFNSHSSVFRSIICLFLQEWERLCQVVVPLLTLGARYTGDMRHRPGRPTKLNEAERLLSFVLYCRHNCSVRYESTHWSYSRSSLSGDISFIASIVNEALSEEIRWPSQDQRQQLSQRVSEFPGCPEHLEGTLSRINQPRVPEHKRYFNNRIKMYCFNNVVIVDHNGLFIYVDAGFVGSYHDVRCLRNSNIH
jgi:hypothetical protein